MEFLEANNTEWCSMWEDLAKDPINGGDPICLTDGYAWEYMGSTEDHHCMRHVKHPVSQQTEFIYLERRRAAISWARIA